MPYIAFHGHYVCLEVLVSHILLNDLLQNTSDQLLRPSSVMITQSSPILYTLLGPFQSSGSFPFQYLKEMIRFSELFLNTCQKGQIFGV